MTAHRRGGHKRQAVPRSRRSHGLELCEGRRGREDTLSPDWGRGAAGSPTAHAMTPAQRRPSASHREGAMMAVRADEDRLPCPCSEVRLGVEWAEKPSDGRTS